MPHLTQDTIWETQENITYKRAKRSALSQQVTKAARNRQDSMTDTHKKQITRSSCM